MIEILQAKLRLFIRKPMLFIGMTVLSIVFAYLLGSSDYVKVPVPVYSPITNLESTNLWNELTRSDTYEFYMVTEEEAEDIVRTGDAEAALEIRKDSFKLIHAADTPNVTLIYNYTETVYSDVLIEENIRSNQELYPEIDTESVIHAVREKKENPTFSVQSETFRGNGTKVIDNQLQTLFGLSLFFVIYTISFNVLNILQEKKEGVWDRIILSPLKKWEMYAGNLIYCFFIGYLQVVFIFLVFKYVAGVDFYGSFGETLIVLLPYVFSIVALSMFLVGIVKNAQQFSAIIPLVSVSMAMIGGAYWPLEIVSSKFLLQLSNFMPITYGMELLKGVTIYGEPIEALLYPISILLLMGVLLIGIGINVMERRSV